MNPIQNSDSTTTSNQQHIVLKNLINVTTNRAALPLRSLKFEIVFYTDSYYYKPITTTMNITTITSPSCKTVFIQISKRINVISSHGHGVGTLASGASQAPSSSLTPPSHFHLLITITAIFSPPAYILWITHNLHLI